MLQPIGVALRPMLGVLYAPVAIQDYFPGQLLEVNFVTVAAAVNAEKQDDRAMHDRRKQDRAGRESSGRAQELALRGLAVARYAVA